MVSLLRTFSEQEETILLSGATGVGKSRLARWCHCHSGRRAGPFETLNLLSVPGELQLAELFGWRRGAFTGAVKDSPGSLARAQGGTLFIDEIDKLSLGAQGAMLQVLEDRTYRSLGDGATHHADVRFVVGTNGDLQAMVREGRFRPDLFFRINVLPIAVPPPLARPAAAAAAAARARARARQGGGGGVFRGGVWRRRASSPGRDPFRLSPLTSPPSSPRSPLPSAVATGACGSSAPSGGSSPPSSAAAGETRERGSRVTSEPAELAALRRRRARRWIERQAGSGAVLSSVEIVPANASLTMQAGQAATLPYKVMGIVNGAGGPVDVTDRFVFWVPDNYLVGDFPTNGGPLFTTRLPSSATDPVQRGGTLTVEADALNPGGQALKATTSLQVQLVAQIDDSSNGADGGADDAGAIPGNASSLFGGTNDPSRAPVLEYPNDGVMLPPKPPRASTSTGVPGASKNTLFQITFTSAAASVTYYTRCGTLGGLLVAGACGFELDEAGYGYLSQSNAGAGNVALTIRGTDDAGTGVGTSATFNLQFAQQSVNGGVYYWDVTDTRIMRFDFGGTSTTPDVFLSPGQYGTSGTCIGCHAISHDGTKMAASAGGQNDGYLEYIANVASPTTPLTANGDNVNRIQFASFNPLGDRFVAVYGDGAPGSNASLTPNNLWFHDGNTGVILPSETKALAFEPDHPCWSPDGTMIAVTHVGKHNTSQREYLGGIDVATFAAGSVVDGGVNVGDAGSSLGDPVVVVPNSVVAGGNAVNSYNPSFAPDSTFLVFSQTTCAAGDSQKDDCDSDIANNNSATTWAVAPHAGAAPIHLDGAAKPGVADGTGAAILDTFPRATPFQTKQGSGKLFWFTVASLRQPGLEAEELRLERAAAATLDVRGRPGEDPRRAGR